MKLIKWMEKATSEEIRKLAKMVKCHHNYLYQVAKDSCSPGLAKKIEKATMAINPRQVVRKHELRPDIWKKGE